MPRILLDVTSGPGVRSLSCSNRLLVMGRRSYLLFSASWRTSDHRLGFAAVVVTATNLRWKRSSSIWSSMLAAKVGACGVHPRSMVLVEPVIGDL